MPGSERFGLLERKRERLACDVIVISDTTMWSADVPSMCTGMRGLAEAEVTLSGPSRDLHSGSFGGGVPNPLHAMASLLARSYDGDRVTLPRFLNRVLPLSEEERNLVAQLPFDEKQWLADAGDSGAASGEAGFSTLERIWARPTAEINGMWGGHTGAGFKTIIPSCTHAKVSFRLVADQDPADVLAAFSEYVQASTPAGLQAAVTRTPRSARAVRRSPHRPCRPGGGPCNGRSAARSCSLRKGAARAEADLADILGRPLVFIGVGLASDRMHAPNERVDVSLLLRGAEACAYLWEELAATGPDLR